MDIDIDFANRNDALGLFKYVKASRLADGNYVAHNSGVYFQNIPHNPLTNLATIDYNEAENRGYFKIDFLNVSLYKDIQSEQQLIELCNKEPIWELLEYEEFVTKLFHIGNHYELVNRLKPKNIEQLAALLAIIRPGKKHLADKSWDEILEQVWLKTDSDEYAFKRSHSYSYAMLIIVQMNLLSDISILGKPN